MKRADLAMVCCPRCHGELEVHATAEEKDEIVEGRLHCKPCDVTYPIANRIANMMPPGHRIEAGYGGYDDWP